jgi:hypothetical protein
MVMNFILLMRCDLVGATAEQRESDGVERGERVRSIPGVVIHRVSPNSASVFFPGDMERLKELRVGTKWNTVYFGPTADVPGAIAGLENCSQR